MKTADRRKPKPLGHSARQPRSWRGRSEQISFDQVGCEARKVPALGEIFFLTSSFIELTRTCRSFFCLIIYKESRQPPSRPREQSKRPACWTAGLPTVHSRPYSRSARPAARRFCPKQLRNPGS